MKVIAAVLAAAPLCDAASLWDAISSHPNAATFSSVVKAAGLDKMLSGSAPLTVFVPSDAAYASWPDYKLKYVLGEAASSLQFSQYAIHQGVLTTDKMTAPMNITTLHPYHQLFVVDASATEAHVNDATCGVGGTLEANVGADNGVFHVVDTVFEPPAAICPDIVYVAEQRTQARIGSYGYQCRSANETRHLTATTNIKPVGLSVDSDSQIVFWADDQDYPRRSPTSWISRVFFNDTNAVIINDTLIDPQGVSADSATKTLYIASHSGYEVARINYDGTGLASVYGQPGNLSFQPSDVKVDSARELLFFSVEGTDLVSGSLWSVYTNGSNPTQLLPNANHTAGLIQNYGLCLDTLKQQVYWVQGGNGGSINCFAYGDVACEQEVVVDTLEYPYMCDIDNSMAPYGGPTYLLWSEANRPGNVYYTSTNVSDTARVHVELVAGLDAPMGVAFGCDPY